MLPHYAPGLSRRLFYLEAIALSMSQSDSVLQAVARGNRVLASRAMLFQDKADLPAPETFFQFRFIACKDEIGDDRTNVNHLCCAKCWGYCLPAHLEQAR